MVGQLNPLRKNLNNLIFSKIDYDKDNVVTFSEIKSCFYPAGHPEIKSGKKTEEDIYLNFIDSLEMHHFLRLGSKDERITRDEFLEFLEIYSASIENDSLYEATVNGLFKLIEEKNYSNVYAGQAGISLFF